jgi:hypothetical protein
MYVGQTIQPGADRFKQHLTDPSSSVYKYLEKELGPGFTENQARRRLKQDLPVKEKILTHYELTVLEQHHIDKHKSSGKLENQVNAMTPENRKKYSGLNNPCT